MNILELKNEYFPHWYFEKVLCPEDLDNFQFYYYDNLSVEKIPCKMVVGTTHCNYYHLAWLEMLTSLKRYRTDSDIEAIKALILQENDSKAVAEYDGKYYIIAGNHRLCQAKFIGIEQVHCSVSKYKFNQQNFNLYKELIDNNFTCTYSCGSFCDIKLGDVCIYLLLNENVSTLISAYKSIKINILDRLLFSKKSVCAVSFDGSKNSYKALKKAMIFYQSKIG